MAAPRPNHSIQPFRGTYLNSFELPNFILSYTYLSFNDIVNLCNKFAVNFVASTLTFT